MTRPMLGFKTLRCARILLAGIEVMHMIRNGQRQHGGLAGAAGPGPQHPADHATAYRTGGQQQQQHLALVATAQHRQHGQREQRSAGGSAAPGAPAGAVGAVCSAVGQPSA